MRASLVFCAAAAAASIAVAVVSRGSAWAAEWPAASPLVIAWGAGVMVAFAAALRAIGLDGEQGVLMLARTRGVTTAEYVFSRVGGVTALIALSVGGATLVAGLAATATAYPALPAARAGVAGLAYSLVFAATLGPVTMAALGSGTRAGGYLRLLAVLVLPEVLAPWTAVLLPAGWHELSSIPAALDAVRVGIAVPGAASLHMARALVGLTAVIAASLIAIVAKTPSVDQDGVYAWRRGERP